MPLWVQHLLVVSYKASPVFHADCVIIGLPCGQGQLSRIGKVQCDWLSLGKECCLRLSRHLWGGMKTSSPKKPVWQATLEGPTRDIDWYFEKGIKQQSLIRWWRADTGELTKKQRQRTDPFFPDCHAFNPFAPRDFAEKRVLKLFEWFSGLCRAIKS